MLEYSQKICFYITRSAVSELGDVVSDILFPEHLQPRYVKLNIDFQIDFSIPYMNMRNRNMPDVEVDRCITNDANVNDFQCRYATPLRSLGVRHS